MKVGCVIVTRGDRPAELSRALASVLAQEGLDLDLVVVGPPATEARAGARLVPLDDDPGPPGARNRGLAQAGGEVVFFLDDDASCPDPKLFARALDRFARDPTLGIVSFRIVDPEGRPPQRRHVPRLRAGDPARSSDVTTFLEGACAIRREVFERVGAYGEEFRFGHEGTDLAWRALDVGYRIAYAGDLVVHHPALPPARVEGFHRLNARNRVFLARRRLPWLPAVLYCTIWLALDLSRSGAARDVLAGFRDGLRAPCGARRPIRWRTVWRMTLLGRPPIV